MNAPAKCDESVLAEALRDAYQFITQPDSMSPGMLMYRTRPGQYDALIEKIRCAMRSAGVRL